MALWAIVVKERYGKGLDWSDPVEADSAEAAMAITYAQREPGDDEEWPQLEAILEEIHKDNRPVFYLAGSTEDPSPRVPVSKHAAAQRRKPKLRKPGKRWS